MKLNPTSIRQPISDTWYTYDTNPCKDVPILCRPKPPTPEMVERAQFVDKPIAGKPSETPTD